MSRDRTWAAAVAALLAACACDVRAMKDQPHHEPYEASPVFPDGQADRPPVPGTVPAFTVVELRRSRAGVQPPPQSPDRGRVLFDGICAACHGRDGYGRGIVVTRGFPAPPSFHTPVLRAASLDHFVTVITGGLGKMPPYGHIVPASDRLAVARWIRVLQLSQHAPVAQLRDDERRRLEEP